MFSLKTMTMGCLGLLAAGALSSGALAGAQGGGTDWPEMPAAETTAEPPQMQADTPVAVAGPGQPAPAAQSAADMPVPSPVVTARTSAVAQEIAEINERIAVLTARLAELELEAKIASKRLEVENPGRPSGAGESEKGTGGGAPSFPGTMSGIPKMPALSFSGGGTGEPEIKEIDAIDGRFRAVLLIDGAPYTVRVGDKIGSLKIKDIQVDSVMVENAGRVSKLGFGAYTAGEGKASSAR